MQYFESCELYSNDFSSKKFTKRKDITNEICVKNCIEKISQQAVE